MNTITGHTGFMGLLGSPVAHSISPLMHNEAFHILGLDYVYLCFDVNEETLGTAVKGLKACGIRGFNLTMPDKNKIIEFLDELSPEARLIGAVNTVLNENGKLIGYNTDGYGFMQALREEGYDVNGKEVTVMGIGGASMAICAQAALDGATDLNIFGRPSSRYWKRACTFCENLQQQTGCRVNLFDNEDHYSLKKSLENSSILINATSVGMIPDTDNSIIKDTSLFYPDLTVADVIYEPRETRLLKEAKAAGCKTVNGMYMLLYQGAKAFKIWTGKDMPVSVIKEKFFSGR